MVLDTLIRKTIELPRSGLNECDSKKVFRYFLVVFAGGLRHSIPYGSETPGLTPLCTVAPGIQPK